MRTSIPPRFLLVAVASTALLTAQQDPPRAARAFERYQSKVKLRWDSKWLYIESDGMPDHEMMTGIRAWQQQVPLPQPYTGDNAWQVPLDPRQAAEPKSARTGFFRGAIAIAVNGVPIFNPIKNDGRTDTLLAGELDLFGGHAGRGDDYHYHIAPVFLNEGDPSRPVAYALDGYPIYGYDEPDGSPVRKLDELNGHDDPKHGYHYHATRTYPYLNAGFRGTVTERGGQVEPQPHAHPVREATTPLRGATITSFTRSKDGTGHTIEYELNGKKGFVDYTVLADGSAQFVFTTPDGKRREETYRRQPQRGRRSGEEEEPRATEDPPYEPPQDPPAPTTQPRRETAPQDPQPAPPQAPAPAQRQPWLAAHLAEIDTDKDGAIAQAELDAECARTLGGYDQDRDSKVSATERDASGGGRSAMGGFVRQHWGEVDADGDGVVTERELRATAQSMFDRADRDRDGKVTRTELEQPRTGGNGRTQGGNQGGNQGGTQGGNQRQSGQGTRGRGYAALETGFRTEVPARPFDIVLVRPTETSVTLSVLSHTDAEAQVEYVADTGGTAQRTPTVRLAGGEPALVELSGLRPDTSWSYRLHHRGTDSKANEFAAGDWCSFHTRRDTGSSFTFTIQADSHLDSGVSPAVYERTLANALADRPDFHVDLGDTFMTGKRPDFHEALPQYLAQRYYFGTLCHSAPLFQILGNHDGEEGTGGRGADEIAGWSFAQRTRWFPGPLTGAGDTAMYSGRTEWRDGKGSNYFAFEWGDALFCMLDPFWPTEGRRRGGGGQGGSENEFTDASWGLTLGREQYDWLAQRLASSKAPWKFVFIHHLVGGRGNARRGGVESAPYFEWGGRNADGSDGFARNRPGWPVPVHQLLVKHGVDVVFHGHDHLYVQNQLDGIVYQCVPQPGNARGNTRSAAEYGYTSGTILGSPGHLRVQVAPDAVRVALVRSVVEGEGSFSGSRERNRDVAHEYELKSR